MTGDRVLAYLLVGLFFAVLFAVDPTAHAWAGAQQSSCG
jgi:hypothetical protein